MMLIKKRQLSIENNRISVKSFNGSDFLSITDMMNSKDGDFFVTDWLRNRNTLEFLGIWESINNPDFNYGEFAIIKSKAGLNNFKISVKEWVRRTNAIGIRATAGRYGGTYAHKDIAFEFGTWISPAFKLYLIKEYQRLKEIENNQYNLEWDTRRVLAKTNYTIHTDAVKDILIPAVPFWTKSLVYSSEADLINLVVFGMTAKEWRKNNPERAKNGENIRDSASIIDLIILSNLESHNAEYIRMGLSKEVRYEKMSQIAKTQRQSLIKTDPVKAIKKISHDTYHKAIDSKK